LPIEARSHTLFPLSELPPGTTRAAVVGGVEVVVLQTPAGQLAALRNRCPHRGARLSHGKISPRLTGDSVGRYALTEEYVLRCPWHGFEIDIASGRCIADPEARVRAYAVTVEDGMVVVRR
jgi:nitrite reductase/ring-hydroxylating ferredoxin subunit